MVPAFGAGFDTLKDAQLAILRLTIDITYMKILGLGRVLWLGISTVRDLRRRLV